ncbi:MAG: hypothetical protein K2N75_04940 [Helicobacter sp.]|uniref:hypothetical protein n=1 Tax=Helicobacter sp. TaxID=218 RepID=UPI0023BF43E0|nr:hypothetical protein [Helicobacter sp.]MDE5926371.1 hypothetical protein [Helicobacter sp.]MDE7175372.1 hypothetical protein [Helicobacter sp.]
MNLAKMGLNEKILYDFWGFFALFLGSCLVNYLKMLNDLSKISQVFSYGEYASLYSKVYKLEKALVVAIIKIESAFNAYLRTNLKYEEARNYLHIVTNSKKKFQASAILETMQKGVASL